MKRNLNLVTSADVQSMTRVQTIAYIRNVMRTYFTEVIPQNKTYSNNGSQITIIFDLSNNLDNVLYGLCIMDINTLDITVHIADDKTPYTKYMTVNANKLVKHHT